MDSTSTLALDAKRTDTPASHLRRTYEVQRALFQAQPPEVQSFLESQSLSLARSAIQGSGQVKFSLPDQVLCDTGKPGETKSTPIDQRQHRAGGLLDSIRHRDLPTALHERLAALEMAKDQGVATGAALIRYTTATAMIQSLLPAGRTVIYQTTPGGEVPNQPVDEEMDARMRLNTMGVDTLTDPEAYEPTAPYAPDARRFYLPQWVAFDEQGGLLVGTIDEARACIASMQEYLAILQMAAKLAPYILADAEYQQKRYGIIGQLVNQGRAMAHYETDQIIQVIQRRIKNHNLNRGISLSLPYYDDQDMELKNLDFEVIPAGRVMFVPAFLVMAVSAEEIEVAHNDWMSASTRQHLLAELKCLRRAFDPRQ